ncbi:S8 family serine peptidase [Actinosynnema sp. NPDC047251]|uniref:S8 family peptidase n=1 Tax=Saccharothrix espanaensis TaxID=103731 RepID=UPI001E595C8C|nr:S8 family serine peptidase [Saccharothrix espanaensis]
MDSSDVISLPELAESWRAEHPDLAVHDPGGPGECLVRSGELLIRSDGVPVAVDRLRRWVDRVDATAEPGFVRIRLRAGEHPVRIAADSGLDVAPNHVHVGSPIMIGTARPLPAPADAPPPPPDETWPVTVAVLDTGLDPHPWFADRSWFAAVPEVLDADGRPGQDRQAGHGTFVTGVLVRHAPGVQVRPRRVLSSLGLTDDLTVARGLRAVRGADVVLLTAGCHTADDRCPPVLRHEVGRLDGVVVAAAGNGGTSRPVWPAALPEVVAVGADAAFSNHGPWVDAIAPGVDVTSSFVWLTAGGRRRGAEGRGAEGREYGCARWSGTSFAAPRVAADLARLLHEGVSQADAVDAVRRAGIERAVSAQAVTG